MIEADTSGTTPTDRLSGLLYELLDAHIDTIKLAGPLEEDESLEESQRWAAHLDYLRGLQRVGRETLARVGSAV
ncbi:MAG TPA: hypothetical protein VGI50_17480 [Solirubrobacteraceae bacterium]